MWCHMRTAEVCTLVFLNLDSFVYVGLSVASLPKYSLLCCTDKENSVPYRLKYVLI